MSDSGWARQGRQRESPGKEAVRAEVRQGGRLRWCRTGSLVGARWREFGVFPGGCRMLGRRTGRGLPCSDLASLGSVTGHIGSGWGKGPGLPNVTFSDAWRTWPAVLPLSF